MTDPSHSHPNSRPNGQKNNQCWVFNIRRDGYFPDSDDSDTEDATNPKSTTNEPSSEDARLMKEIDLGSREETVSYKPNPFSLAKINAATRAKPSINDNSNATESSKATEKTYTITPTTSSAKSKSSLTKPLAKPSKDGSIMDGLRRQAEKARIHQAQRDVPEPRPHTILATGSGALSPANPATLLPSQRDKDQQAHCRPPKIEPPQTPHLIRLAAMNTANALNFAHIPKKHFQTPTRPRFGMRKAMNAESVTEIYRELPEIPQWTQLPSEAEHSTDSARAAMSETPLVPAGPPSAPSPLVQEQINVIKSESPARSIFSTQAINTQPFSTDTNAHIIKHRAPCFTPSRDKPPQGRNPIFTPSKKPLPPLAPNFAVGFNQPFDSYQNQPTHVKLTETDASHANPSMTDFMDRAPSDQECQIDVKPEALTKQESPHIHWNTKSTPIQNRPFKPLRKITIPTPETPSPIVKKQEFSSPLRSAPLEDHHVKDPIESVTKSEETAQHRKLSTSADVKPSAFHTPAKRQSFGAVRDAYSFQVHDPDEEWSTLPPRKKRKQQSPPPRNVIRRTGPIQLPAMLLPKTPIPPKPRVITFLPPPLQSRSSREAPTRSSSDKAHAANRKIDRSSSPAQPLGETTWSSAPPKPSVMQQRSKISPSTLSHAGSDSNQCLPSPPTSDPISTHIQRPVGRSTSVDARGMQRSHSQVSSRRVDVYYP
ncbi:hypothetical protein AX16_002318 [Volvariella volvacea WC 439]|nr:hypothetical protein AX16_002318 [Volvariella volvacea WC 439]